MQINVFVTQNEEDDMNSSLLSFTYNNCRLLIIKSFNIIYLMSWREVTVIFFDLRDLIPSKQA